MSVIISHDEIKINDNGKGYTAYKYELEDRGDFLLIVVRDSLYTFRYRESKNDLCLYIRIIVRILFKKIEKIVQKRSAL